MSHLTASFYEDEDESLSDALREYMKVEINKNVCSSLSKGLIQEIRDELKQSIIDEIKHSIKQPIINDLKQETLKTITSLQQQVTNKYIETNKQLQRMYNTQTNMHIAKNNEVLFGGYPFDIDNYVVLLCTHNFCFSCLNQQRKHECAICRKGFDVTVIEQLRGL